MVRLLALTFRSPRRVLWLAAAIVAIAAWCIQFSGQTSAVLFLAVLVAGAFIGPPLSPVLAGVIIAFVCALIFVASCVWRRTPRSADQVARYNRSTCIWLVVYLSALFWFRGAGEFSL